MSCHSQMSDAWGLSFDAAHIRVAGLDSGLHITVSWTIIVLGVVRTVSGFILARGHEYDGGIDSRQVSVRCIKECEDSELVWSSG